MIGKCNTGGGKSSGLYMWKKLSSQGGIFIEYVVSDNPNKYPNGGEQGGYYYEMVEDVTPEVTAQTPVITQILEGLVGKAQGANATADKILEGYSAYVGGVLLNGTAKQGKLGIDFGEVTLASTAESVTVSHNLGVIPSFVALIPKTLSDSTDYNSYLGFNNKVAIKTMKTVTMLSSSTVALSDCENTLTTNEITFNGTSSYPWHPTDYYWIAIA